VGERYVLNLYDSRSRLICGDQPVDLVNGRFTSFFGRYGSLGAGQAKMGLLKDSNIGVKSLPRRASASSARVKREGAT